MEFKQTLKQQKRDFKLSVLDGIFWAIMYYLSSMFLSPLIIHLGASPTQVGLLSSLPLFLASFLSLIAYNVLGFFNSRRQLVVSTVYVRCVLWVVIGLVPLFFSAQLSIWIIIICYIIIIMLKYICTPVYTDWISKVFDHSVIGSYLAKKSLILDLVSIIPILVAGFILGNSTNNAIYIFAIIFILSGICRVFSGIMLSKMSATENNKDIKKEIKEVNKPVWSVFKKEVLDDKIFGQFIFTVIVIYFALYVCSPYFAYYLFNVVKMNYFNYVILQIIFLFGGIFSIRYWGLIVDRFGVIKVIKSTYVLIAIYPILFLLTVNNYVLLMVLYLFDGMVSSGYNLAITNYFYKNIKEDVIHHFAFFNILQSTAIIIGTTVGSFLIGEFGLLFGLEKYGLIAIFIIAFILRLIAIYFVYKLKDPNVRKIHLIKKILSHKPIRFGLHKLKSFIGHEEKIITHKLIIQEHKFQRLLKKEEKEITKFVNKEKKVLKKKFVKKK